MVVEVHEALCLPLAAQHGAVGTGVEGRMGGLPGKEHHGLQQTAATGEMKGGVKQVYHTSYKHLAGLNAQWP